MFPKIFDSYKEKETFDDKNKLYLENKNKIPIVNESISAKFIKTINSTRHSTESIEEIVGNTNTNTCHVNKSNSANSFNINQKCKTIIN